MCIRDRFGRRGLASVDMGHNPEVAVAVQGVFACHDVSLYPVSYTHLRAHETVLDLVCRLLLEKKNTKYSTIHTMRLLLIITTLHIYTHVLNER